MGKFRIMHIYLEQTKREREIQRHLLEFLNTSLYGISKEPNIPPLSAKCEIAQVKCFKKWKNMNCIISVLLREISCYRSHAWNKESNILLYKLDKYPSKKEIVNFYWDKDIEGKSIKAKAYKKK